jgi:DEAD/DEAH box helicase domain-containing protein
MLSETMNHLYDRSAAAVVARVRIAHPVLNSVLRRRLAAPAGEKDALLTAPIYESARIWRRIDKTLGDLSGNLLAPRLVDALDQALAERMPRERKPYRHQLEAWQASADGLSCMVTSGTGSGKTECFMIPMLDSLLRDPAQGLLTGVRAIIIYPLNALIESQRERLDAWTQSLEDRMRYALYTGLTPEKPSLIKSVLGRAELGDRRSIREHPPSILITNVTMLEYLLLRSRDQPILERSQGLLRWIVLDEAHSYVGAQAAEMALLLRRVRAAFAVQSEQVQLIATSATISDGGAQETDDKLKRFVADLAGTSEAKVCVIHGLEEEPELPAPGDDFPLQHQLLHEGSENALWECLASHPRIHHLRRELKKASLQLSEISQILYDKPSHPEQAQAVLDAAARARDPNGGRLLLPWRAHLFHRALGGIWVCVNPSCQHRDPELAAMDADWDFGGVWLTQRDRCECGAPVFELHYCSECGTPYLVARRESGAKAHLRPLREIQGDDYVIDQEPDPEDNDGGVISDKVRIRPSTQSSQDRHLCVKTGELFDNGAPEGVPTMALEVTEINHGLTCCPEGSRASLQHLRFGPPFFMGNSLPDVMELVCPPMGEQGLPMGGRRALSFSDSRQGVARLAAKLQQDAERTLTRSFLYHTVQEGQTILADERLKLEKKLKLLSSDPQEYADEIADINQKLDGTAAPVMWGSLIQRLAEQSELRAFCTQVWAERSWGGDVMARDPQRLAEMFLYRELFRRPRVQNNAETMGLVRLTFPEMEKRARMDVPRGLQYAGVTPDGWAGLAQTAVDFIFRDNFAIWIQDDYLARWINPRRPGRRSVYRRGTAFEEVQEQNANFWPRAKSTLGRLSRFQTLLYSLIKGNAEDNGDVALVEEILDRLWSLITATAARDAGRGAWRIDFSRAAVARLEQGWLCPITRRILGYNPGGYSPYGPDENRPLTSIKFPRLPTANAGGLSKGQRLEVDGWCRKDMEVFQLRTKGLWTDLHDRIANYPPFLRAQEHSAQIQRPVLQRYEELFGKGQINLLNCSTTMEMGVDIPNVSLVVNSNVPPSISNYRQRVGRAGRRGEPWAFGLTFCRNLPWDQVAFADPVGYLTASISAPAVRMNSVPIVTRHVHAALLGSFLRTLQGMSVKTSVGEFFGGTEQVEAVVAERNLADSFLEQLREREFLDTNIEQLRNLVRGTALEDRSDEALCAETATSFERLLEIWRNEYRTLLQRAASASESDVRRAFENRARRMHGEFILSELARRGFTPSYGFPVDVVSFDHIADQRSSGVSYSGYGYGEYQGGASRTLDIAIREYAPGAEIVIDGLVYQSEGIRPAWSATADVSRLEDLQVLWSCRLCGAHDLVRSFQDVPETCAQCGAARIEKPLSTLRPTGFMGRSAPHTSYESLGHLPYEMPQLAARTPWQALPDRGLGRIRADREGQVITRSSGADGCGYAVCMSCGRSESEKDDLDTPGILKDHKPLAPIRTELLVRGACPGGLTLNNKIRRHVRLIHEMRTDVFELQLPQAASRPQGLALAAGLREALVKKLGVEAREIGLAVGPSCDEARNQTVSTFLYDRMAGGSGLVERLGEYNEFKSCLEKAIEVLYCREDCRFGCPACILRPDMYFDDGAIDRPGALELARNIFALLVVPLELQVFGGGTRILGQPLCNWIERQKNAGQLQELIVFLHGSAKDWQLSDWKLAKTLPRLREHNVPTTLVLTKKEITSNELELQHKLELHRLAGSAHIAMTDELPRTGKLPVLAYAKIAGQTVAIAAADLGDETPGPRWGVGETRPIVFGDAVVSTRMHPMQTDRLIELSSGNAKLISVHSQIDGIATGFGKRFWKILEQLDPLRVANLRNQRVARISYQDRYLKSPLNVKLLFEVLETVPGKTAQTQIEIITAALEYAGMPGYCAYHDFSEEQQRKEVIEQLMPDAQLRLRQKRELSHARRLELVLANNQVMTILLDQGFGAWKAQGSPRHDFKAAPEIQATAIRKSTYEVSMAEKDGMPIVIERSPEDRGLARPVASS